MHSDCKKRRSSYLVALLFATGDEKRYASGVRVLVSHILCLVIATVYFTGCGFTKMTQKEKDELNLEIENVESNIIDPIIGVALSACRYYMAFEAWPYVNFVSTPQSSFDKFAVTSLGTSFSSRFKLKSSDFIFYLNLTIAESKPYCIFDLIVAHPDKSKKKLTLRGIPIVLGETWVSEIEWKKLAIGFLIVSKVSNSVPSKRDNQDSNVIDKLLSTEIKDAFLKVSLCSVLKIEPKNCQQSNKRDPFSIIRIKKRNEPDQDKAIQ